MIALQPSALTMNSTCQFQSLPGAALWGSKLPTKKICVKSKNFFSVAGKSAFQKSNLRVLTRSQAVAVGDPKEIEKDLKTILANEVNVGEASRLLRELGSSDVPEHFIIKDRKRHGVPLTPVFDEFVDLPVIDLSLLSSDPDRVVKQVSEAFEEYGFLQVINHGVPLELLEEHQTLAREFMDLPVEVKDRGDLGRFAGYNGGIKNEDLGVPQQSWVEAMNIQRRSEVPVMLDAVLGALWPGVGNPRIRTAFLDLEREVMKLNRTVHELIALSLGLDKDTFGNLYDADWVMTTRWNHYPMNPKPDEVYGSEAHVDSYALTVLHQDDVGGLQIKHGDKWIGIKPVEGALVVNVGDIIQVLSNDKYISVEHRVVLNSKRNRMTVCCFILPNYTMTLSTPEEILSEENPRKYRPFTCKEYHHIVLNPKIELLFDREKIARLLGVNTTSS